MPVWVHQRYGKKLFTAINKTEQHIVNEGTTSWSNNLPDKTTFMEKWIYFDALVVPRCTALLQQKSYRREIFWVSIGASLIFLFFWSQWIDMFVRYMSTARVSIGCIYIALPKPSGSENALDCLICSYVFATPSSLFICWTILLSLIKWPWLYTKMEPTIMT